MVRSRISGGPRTFNRRVGDKWLGLIGHGDSESAMTIPGHRRSAVASGQSTSALRSPRRYFCNS